MELKVNEKPETWKNETAVDIAAIRQLFNSCIAALQTNTPPPLSPTAPGEALRARVRGGHHSSRGALHQEEDGAQPHLPGQLTWDLIPKLASK